MKTQKIFLKLDQFIKQWNVKHTLWMILFVMVTIYGTLRVFEPKIIYTPEQTSIQVHVNSSDETPQLTSITEPDVEDNPVIAQREPTEKKVVVESIPKTEPKTKKKVKITAHELSEIAEVKEVIVKQAKKFNIPPSIKMAQYAVESGWGRNSIATNNKNYFGIKKKREKNQLTDVEKTLITGFVKRKTNEYNKNGKYQIEANFYVYKNRWASINHHSRFLRDRIDNKKNQGYAKMANLKLTDYKGWANALQESGYSTAPDYAKKLINIIERHELYRWDR